MKRAVIAGIGMSVPEKILSNADLEKMVDTTDEWIVQRTGMKERRVCGEDEAASDLSIRAAREALERSGTDPSEIDLVIVGTVSGDYHFPSTACIVQNALGIKEAGALDVGAACAGFIYAMDIAASMVENGRARKALVVGVDVLSKIVDYSDRGTCILFGDGAGAVVLEGREDTDRGLLKTILRSDGEGGRHIVLESGGTRYPGHAWPQHQKNQHVFMAGNEVYRFAVHAMGDACLKLLEKVGLTSEDIDLFVPHQANIRIIESAAHKLKLPPEKVFINVEKYGNTSAGSIPIGLYEAAQQGRLQEGMLVMTVGFGAGLVWGANLIRW